MYPAFAKWIQSYRDLPLKLNQWNNVVVCYIYYLQIKCIYGVVFIINMLLFLNILHSDGNLNILNLS